MVSCVGPLAVLKRGSGGCRRLQGLHALSTRAGAGNTFFCTLSSLVFEQVLKFSTFCRRRAAAAALGRLLPAAFVLDVPPLLLLIMMIIMLLLLDGKCISLEKR